MNTSSDNSNHMIAMLPLTLKISAVLWAIWGIFHLFIDTTGVLREEVL